VTWPKRENDTRLCAFFDRGSVRPRHGIEASWVVGSNLGLSSAAPIRIAARSPGNLDEGQDPLARRKNGPTGVNMSAAGGTTRAGAGFPDTPATPSNPATHAVSLGFPAPSGFRTSRRPEGLVVARPRTGPDSRTPLRRPSNPATHAVSLGFPAPLIETPVRGQGCEVVGLGSLANCAEPNAAPCARMCVETWSPGPKFFCTAQRRLPP
jgi:hypothetical protein